MIHLMNNPYGGDRDDFKVFTLPTAGSVLVWGPEMDLIQTKEFQRLAGVRQLGTSNVVFRGATHTRFEHSIGTMSQAERLVQAVNRNPTSPVLIDGRPYRFARLMALLHDITHVPFGHTLEDELSLLRRHDANPDRLHRLALDREVGDILRRVLGDDYELFVKMLLTSADDKIADLEFAYVNDLVGNTVCADLLDYVQRDLRACGMPVALGERFLDFFTVTQGPVLDQTDVNRMALHMDKRGMPRPDVESEVVKLLSYRYELAERVYFHHAKNSASVMIGRAVYLAGLVGDDTPQADDSAFDWLSDDSLLRALANPEIAQALKLPRMERSPEALALASELANGVLHRDLYKIAYLGVRDDLENAAEGLYTRYGSAAARRELEDNLARIAEVDPGQILIHLPEPGMLLKPAGVRVVTSDGRIVTLAEWDEHHSGRTAAIVQAHKRLWRVAVYVDPQLDLVQRDRVRAAAETTFGAESRYVEPSKLTRFEKYIFSQNSTAEGWTPEDERLLDREYSAQSEAVTYEDTLDNLRTAIPLLREQQSPGESTADETEAELPAPSDPQDSASE